MIAIAYLTYLQAIDYMIENGDPASGADLPDQAPALAKVRDAVREFAPYIDEDGYLYADIENMVKCLDDGRIIDLIEEQGISL